MPCFSNQKLPIWVNFVKVFDWKMSVFVMAISSFYGKMVYFMAIRFILWPFGIFSRFGMLYREKSGNPA
jgi:hypothetical protein